MGTNYASATITADRGQEALVCSSINFSPSAIWGMETGFGSQRGNQNIGRCNSRLPAVGIFHRAALCLS
jgi:hypothetical protein